MEITKADLVKGGVGLVTGGPLGAVLSPIVGRAVVGRTWAWALIGLVAGPMSWVISTLPIALLTYQPERASQPETVEEAPAAAAPEPAAVPDPVTTVPEKPAPVLERIPSERVPEAAAPITAPVPAPASTGPTPAQLVLREKLAELEQIRKTQEFKFYGIATGGPYKDWDTNLDKALAPYNLTFKEKLGAGELKALLREYIRSRGQDTKASEFFRQAVSEAAGN